MRRLHLFKLILVLAAGGSYVSAFAQSIEIKSTMTEREAKVEARLPDEFSAFREKVKKDPSIFLRGASEISQILTLSSQLAPSKESDRYTKLTGERQLLVEFKQASIAPDSIFTISENYDECGDLSVEEAKCPQALELKITGPIHSYRPAFEVGSPRFPLEAFQFTIEAKPADRAKSAGTKVTFKMKLTDARHMEFLRTLQQKGRIKTIPSDKEIYGWFLLWGQKSMADWGKK
ncbi:MAG: hypothetical protein ABL958_02830 [Bdellovibrionia bacterium]